MSDNNFSVNADAMTPAVDGLAQLGDRLGQITQNLESTLDGLGTPWGEDKNGHNFFQQYGKSRDQTLSGMSSMVDAVHGVSKGINTMIKGYNNINDQAKERARNLQTTGGDSSGGGGGGDSSGGGGGDQSQLQPTQRFMAARMPAEPLQRASLRKGELLPEESFRERDGEPLSPTLMSRDAEEPASPLLAREGEPVQPADRGVLPEGFMPAEQGTLAEPLSPLLPRERGQLMPAEENVPAGQFVRDDAPSTEGTVTTPLQPREYAALQPATQGEFVRKEALQPAEPLMPAERVRMDALRPTEGTPMQPFHEARMEPLMPAERVRMDAVQPAQPLMAAEHVRMADAPVTPLQPAHYMSVRPAIPAEQPVAFDRVEASVPAEQPLAFDRVEASVPAEQPLAFERLQDSVPGEPAGFAELEPERYLAQREPEVPKQ